MPSELFACLNKWTVGPKMKDQVPLYPMSCRSLVSANVYFIGLSYMLKCWNGFLKTIKWSWVMYSNGKNDCYARHWQVSAGVNILLKCSVEFLLWTEVLFPSYSTTPCFHNMVLDEKLFAHVHNNYRNEEIIPDYLASFAWNKVTIIRVLKKIVS